MEWREIAGSVMEQSFRIHNLIGLGLLESVYQTVRTPMPVFLSAPPREPPSACPGVTDLKIGRKKTN